jgi:hypothetical protein
MAMLLLTALLLVCGGIPAMAQCPMCRTAVAAGGDKAGSTFDRAILVLLVPAVALFSSVFVLSIRYRNTARRDQPPASGQ